MSDSNRKVFEAWDAYAESLLNDTRAAALRIVDAVEVGDIETAQRLMAELNANRQRLAWIIREQGDATDPVALANDLAQLIRAGVQ